MLYAVALLGCIMAAQNADIGFTSLVGQVSREYPRHSEGDIVELDDGTLLLAWTRFTGGGADHSTAHIAAMTSEDGGLTWSDPYVIQENTGKQNVMSLSFLRLKSGKIGMFYLEKNGNSDLQVHFRYSADEAKTWGPIQKVPTPAGYSIVNNDRIIQLKTGRIIVPISYEFDISVADDPLLVFCMYSDDEGRTWKRSVPDLKCPQRGAMEPGVVELANGRVLMVIRNQTGRIYSSLSTDRGATWSEARPTDVQSPESPATIKRIPGTRNLLLVWNNNGTGSRQRSPLTAAVSKDNGKTWLNVKNIEDDPTSNYAYISVDFVKDRVLLTYYDNPKGGGWNLRFRNIPLNWFTE